MSLVIDVDTHWSFSWEFNIGKSPLKRFADSMPNESGMLTFFLTDGLYNTLPVPEQVPTDSMFPKVIRPNGDETHIPLHWEPSRQDANAEDRVAWMDRVGIDFAIVNSGGFPAAFPMIDDVEERKTYCRMSNDLLADALEPHKDRLAAVTYADLTDLDWAIGEIKRMRARGSRAFSIRAEPVSGMSLGHPHFDPLWHAIIEAGMIVSVHVGLAPVLFGEWGRMGLDLTKEADRGSFIRMANSQRWHTAELCLSALLFGGVFERHPNLTVLIAELQTAWLPNFYRRMEGLTHPAVVGAMGPWLGTRTAGEYMKRQVRVSPLPGLGDHSGLDVFDKLPEMVVWSSDFPHTEGNADPINLYGDRLRDMDPALRTAFLGGTMAECFDRMGDPIVVKAPVAAA